MQQPELVLRRVIEYKDFFAGEEPIDVQATLKRFSRSSLVRMVAIMSLHYGNMDWPSNNVFFSSSSKKHITYLNKLFHLYNKKFGVSQDQKVEVLTYRTSLELWRQVFAIRADEFLDEIEETDIELVLFKVILSMNEKIMSFKDKVDQYHFDELLYLNRFLTNDSNNYEFNTVILPQLHYFFSLIRFIPSNEVLKKATQVLFNKWGITSWQQYYTTCFIVAKKTDEYMIRNENGVPIISYDWIQQNQKFISCSLLEHLSIKEDDYIPCTDEDAPLKELNIDYRRFRSRPFVKLKDGSGFVVINNQLVCERLFNSLFFDFAPLINGQRNSVGFFDYNKDFIEKALFRNTFFKCLPSNCYTYPVRGVITEQEETKEPDFYARIKRGKLILVECKAIKMNGECRDDGDYHRLLEELHEKIVRKTKNLDPTRKEHKGAPEPIGVGQLVNHINSIEEDTFQWDDSIPDDVRYYPIIVFEDVKLVQKGILSIVNRWFYEEVTKEWKELTLSEITCMPIMVTSINTLYLYDDFLLKRGLINVIDTFVCDNAVYDETLGWYKVSEIADFDEYLRMNHFNKRRDIFNWHNMLMYGQN